MKAGRKSNYRSNFPALLYEYVKRCEKDNKMPMLKEYCYENGINPEKISRYSESNKTFRQAVDYLKFKSESYLLSGGIKRTVDPNFAKFLLSTNHGYIETSKQIQEGKETSVVVIDSSKVGYVPKPPQGVVTTPDPKANKPS